MFTVFHDWSRSLSGGQRLFAFLATLVFVSLLVTFLTVHDIFRTAVIGTVAIAVIYFGMSLALPSEERRNRIRRFSLYVALVVSTAVIYSHGLLPLAVADLLGPYISPHIAGMLRQSESSSITIVLIFVLASIFIVNYFMRDTTAMGVITRPLRKEFPDLNFSERLELFCHELRHNLDQLDHETRWSHRDYVPLDAEVDVVQGDRRRRRVMDLFTGVRRHGDKRLFLVLGDPGSGKSVALRKLCRELLPEVKRTGRIPIYINLREWRIDRAWSRENPPTEDHLYHFVRRSLKARIANVSKSFVDDYFHILLERGRLFFVFDSFDEIPGILDANETSWLIAELSDVLVRFILGGQDARGLLASRHYRRPKVWTPTRCILEIRPFSEPKIAAAIDQISGNPDPLKEAIFRIKPELGPVARNPFMLSLFLQYTRTHLNPTPDTRSDLFDSYLDESLALASDDLVEHNLSGDEVLATARAIAWVMFNSDRFGLEMPIALLREALPNHRIDEVVELLVAARIGRISHGFRAFSFVHRRFNEYFLINTLLEHPEQAPRDAIPEDSRWRDAMVLFAEVADDDTARDLAIYCWAHTQPLFSTSTAVPPELYFRALHSLRFLTEAFRGRRRLLAGFEVELTSLVEHVVAGSDDLVTIKNAVEAVGLLPESSAQQVIRVALDRDNEWISETALRSCRYLVSLGAAAESKVGRYLLRLPPMIVLSRYRELAFSFQTADTFRNLRDVIRARRRDIMLHVAALVILTLIYFPIVFVALSAGMVMCMFCYFFRKVADIAGARVSARQARFILAKIGDPIDFARFSIVLFGFFFFVLAALLMPLADTTLTLDVGRLSGAAGLYIVRVVDTAGWWVVGRMSGAEIGGSTVGAWAAFAIFLLALMPVFSLRHYMRGADWEEIGFLGAIYASAPLAGMVLATGALLVGLDRLMLALAVFGGTVGLGGGAVGGLRLIRVGREHLVDRQMLRTRTRAFVPNRMMIAGDFLTFQTERYRLRYVRWVEEHAGDYLDALADRQNAWPGGRRPNVNNDRASTLLAQLDARWMRLEA